MAKVRTKNIKKRQRKAQRKTQRKQGRRRWRRRMRQVNIGRAARNPKAPPRTRGCWAAKFWQRFKLGEHLESIGVCKEKGLALTHIMLIVMLFGLMNATSLSNVVEEVNRDVVLRNLLGKEKDYPLLSEIYEPGPEQEAEKEAARKRKEMGLDLRSTADRIAWLKHEVAREEKPEWIELGGRDLSASMRTVVGDLDVPWIGVSGLRRTYHLKGRSKPKAAKELLKIKRSRQWLDLPDLGYQLCWLGETTGTRVRLYCSSPSMQPAASGSCTSCRPRPKRKPSRW
ncbi:MAG: hypothetical protein SXV54_04070 [Chloroflexota bacterium]|nr:hypothetical protein [Chloroflexota bacterium]